MNQPYYWRIIKSHPKNKEKFIKCNFIFNNPYNIIPITMSLNDNYIIQQIYQLLQKLRQQIKKQNRIVK